MNADVTAILRCPVTKSPLRRLSPEEIRQTNSLISKGKARHREGTPVQQKLEAGFVSQDGRYAYPLHQGIIFLLASGAVVLGEEPPGEHPALGLRKEKKGAQDFYDQIGWRRDKASQCRNLRGTEDSRAVSEPYRTRCNLRVSRHLPSSGEYLLDVACGPVKDQYLSYSHNYKYRLCVDLSVVALQKAREKLGHKGIYLLADITNLPLQDDLVEGAVSLHTIYHVPQDEQAQAFRELHRVLKPGGSAVVAYTWGPRSPLMKAALAPARAWQTLRKRAAGRRDQEEPASPAGPQLYFRPHTYRWFAEQEWGFKPHLRVWRSVSAPFMDAYIHGPLLGRQILAVIYGLEETFPRLAGRVGQFPMFVIRK